MAKPTCYSVNGETLTAVEMAGRAGISARAMYHRLNKLGLPPEQAIAFKRITAYDFMGIPTPVREICRILHMSDRTLYYQAEKNHTMVQTQIDIATLAAIMRGKLKKRNGWLPEQLKEDGE